MPTTLPIADPVLIFALAMGIFLVAPVVFERLKIPGLVGLIVFGAIVGPNVLNLLERDFTFELLGQVGLLYLVFLAGLELDLNRFNEYRRRSIGFGLLSFGIPMALAVAIMPMLGFGIPAAILIGSIIGSHTLLAYPVASRLGILKNPAMITVVGGTLVTDTLALTVLAVVAGSLQGELTPAFWLQLFGVLGLYVAVVLIAVPRVGRWFFRNVPSQAPAEFIFLMVVLFVVAWGARLAGAEPIIGAFLAGLTLNRLIPLQSPLMTRVRFVGNALFIPFFLLSVGMLVDPGVLVESTEVWILAGVLTALVLLGKFGGAWSSRLLFKYNRAEGMAMFGLSSPQAAATLAVTFVGWQDLQLFDETVVNAVIIMIMVTVFVGPSILERFGRAVALQEERKPYDPSEAPRRILIPISNPATADALMDISFLLRGKDSEEPLYPLMVVRGTEEGSEAQVAEAEKMLSHAVLYSAGADVPVAPLTRVDRNIANGINRAVAETRTSIVIVGWDGRSSGSRTSVYGTVLDQLLEQTRQTVIVSKMGHPLNTTSRIVLVVPRASERHPGFGGSVSLVKRLATEVDASLEVLVVGEEPSRCAEVLRKVKPEHPMEFEEVEGWGPLLWELRTRLEPQDLVVVLSARKGTLSWTRELEKLPGQLASLVPESFLIFYPSEAESGLPAHSGTDLLDPEALPSTLTPERIVFDVPGGAGYREALKAILNTHFPAGPQLNDVVERLAASEEEFSSEIREGVALPHALLPGLHEPIMFFGVSAEGVQFPNAEAPTHAIFVLLGPLDRRFDHLRLLTRMARLLRKPREDESLRELRDLGGVYSWFRDADPAGNG
jgi:Kef-type K+ transport system membrane component KefB/mannitol/fructose-specific phosphotransferase system IIA component (Ntr-type)